MRNSLARPVAASALLLLAGAPRAPAQEPADTLPEPEQAIVLPRVVVTASRLALPWDAVPAAVATVTGAELDARGTRSVEETLRTLAGASVAQTGSYGAMAALFLRGGESDYVRVLVDGVPVNRPGGEYDLAHLTTDNVERIEVVRGPASVLYGSDAMTGVVQVFTRRGAGEPRASVLAQAGSHGSVHVRADVAGGSGAAGYAFGVSHFATDGIHEINSDYRNTVLSGRVEVRPDPRSDATFAVRYSDNVFHYPTDGAGRMVRDGVRHEDVITLSLDAGRYFTERVEGRILITANEIGGGFDDRPLDPAAPGRFEFWSVENVARRGLDARANLHLGPGTVATLGTSAERQGERSLRESRSEWGDDVDYMDVSRSTVGGYLQLVAAPAPGLSVTGGVRVERNQQFGSHATYRAGASYTLLPGLRARAAFGTGFKEPTFFENFATGLARGNPELDPERSLSWEAGLDRSMAGGAIRLSATWFDQRFRDMIQYSPQPFGSDEPNYFNVAAAAAEGLELEAAVSGADAPWLPANGWLRASFTWLNARVTDSGFQGGPGDVFVENERLIRRPSHTAGLVIGFRPAVGAGLSVSANQVGPRDDIDFADWPAERVTLPAHTRVDVAADVAVLRRPGGLAPVVLTARVENLFDASYEEIRNYPARGRAVFLGTRLAF